MVNNNKNNWKIRFAIVMFILAITIFLSKFLILGDGEEIISYIWQHLGFIPVDILVVAFLLEEIMSRKEKEAILEKLDMLMGTFFSEVGNDLINELTTVNKHKISTENLKSIKSWDENDFKDALKKLNNTPPDFDADVPKEEREKFLSNIKNILANNREFLVNLLNNPNLLEKDEFSTLIISLFHLDEELEHRSDLTNISDADFNHLNGDMKRVYSKLVYEWIYYLEYLYNHYPYVISLAIRTNPFDEDADVHIIE